MSIRPSTRAPFRKPRSIALTAAAVAVCGATLAPLAAGALGAGATDTASPRSTRIATELRLGAASAPRPVATNGTAAKKAPRTMTIYEFAAAVDRAKYLRILIFAALLEQAKQQAAAINPVWDQLAQCESGGNWSINTGMFDGGLQFLPSTWRAQGGGDFAPFAYQATREQQITVAERLRASTGGSYRASWPGCSRHLGLS